MINYLTLNTLLLCAACCISGCSNNQVYKVGTYVVEDYSEVIITPHILEGVDIDVACQLGSVITPLLGAMNALSESKKKTLSLLHLLSANCSEQKANEAELKSIRGLRSGNNEDAKDSRISQKRWLKITALRRKESFINAMSAYDYNYKKTDETCPEFSKKLDETVFLLGLITGLQAIISDAGAELSARVPRNIASAAARASYCLNDTQWGGMPSSIRASVWLLLPDLSPKNIDPWKMLNAADSSALKFGVRIPLALHAIIAESTGNEMELRRALSYLEEISYINKELSLLDKIALSHLLAVSDRHWTKSVGVRTPFSNLGSLFENNKDENDDVFDDYL